VGAVAGDTTGDRQSLLEMLARQARACQALGSPFYAALLAEIAADVEAGGPAWRLLGPHASDPEDAAVLLRLLGAVHRLVLEGAAPALARHYPSVGGDGDIAGAWREFRVVLDARADVVRAGLARPPQTNEVGRSAALVCGFLTVARETGRPLRLLEVGASAGLHLRFDHFRYEAGERTFGPAASPVRFARLWEGTPPPLDAPCVVASREGCDLNPVDPTREDGRLTLLSYVWPDQEHRLAILRGALSIAARVPASVGRASAPDWLRGKLGRPVHGVASVVFHAIVWPYLAAAERARVQAVLEEAGAAATSDAPIAWLRFEPSADRTRAEVRLTAWPGGEDRLLATAGFHGRPVRCLR
jgi:hypothetical protein